MFSILILFCLLVSCGIRTPNSQPTMTINSSIAVTPTSTTLATISSTLMSTAKPPTPTVMEAPTITPPLTMSAVTQICLEITGKETDLDAVSDLGKVVILDNLNDRRIYHILDLYTDESFDLPLSNPDDPFYTGMTVSPDGSTLVYREGRHDKAVWVVTAEGKVLGKYPPFEMGLVGERWIDNERMELDWNGSSYPPDIEQGGVVIFDPFTGQRQYLAPTFPDVYDTSPPAYWTAQYSSDLEWAVYVQWWPEQGPGIGVWDVAAQRIIWQQQESIVTSWRSPPVWVSSGEWVALLVDGVLYRINRTGDVMLLPELSSSSWGFINSFSGSPDGHYLAFWVTIVEGFKETKLFILDTETNQLFDYCINNDFLSGRIIWSFNGQQFIIQGSKQNNNGQLHNQVILVDRVQQKAYLLSPDQVPLAWLRSRP